MGLSVALFLCSGKESCFHFVNSGGMDQLAYVFSQGMEISPSITLFLLGVIEQATRHSIGCETFLGWWPREDENVPSGASEGYSRLLNLLLQKPRHDVASLVTSVLHRLRFYEVASRYEVCISFCDFLFLGNWWRGRLNAWAHVGANAQVFMIKCLILLYAFISGCCSVCVGRSGCYWEVLH